MKRGAAEAGLEIWDDSRPPPRQPRETNASDWTCVQCGNVNYDDRMYCNMRRCGAPKPGGGVIELTEWHCPNCGNFNHADRMVCNMRKCSLPRPGIPPGYAQGAAKGGSKGSPPAIVPGLSGGYGMMGNGDARHFVNGFNSVPGLSVTATNHQRPFNCGDGQWACPKCGNMNFADRTHCNMRRCGAARNAVGTGQVSRPRPPPQGVGGLPAGIVGVNLGGVPSTDRWRCKCGNFNFQDRTVCNMRKCGLSREEGELKERSIQEATDTWLCAACGNENFGDRMVCNMRKCRAQREL